MSITKRVLVRFVVSMMSTFLLHRLDTAKKDKPVANAAGKEICLPFIAKRTLSQVRGGLIINATVFITDSLHLRPV